MLGLCLLLLGLHNVLVKVRCEALEQILTISGRTFVHFGKCLGRVLSHSEDVVTQMGDPKRTQFFILGS